MHKKRSLLLSLLFLLSLFILAACSDQFSGNPDKRFESYTRKLFAQEVSANTITLHYTLNHPESYNIQGAPITFGSCTTDADALCAASENAQSALRKHNRRRLSQENRLTYDILNRYFESSINDAPFTLYEEPLAPLTGTQSQIPVLLSEYHFSGRKDVDTYLELLTKFPDYFHSLIQFEQAKSEAGLFMPSYTADAIIEECNSFISMGDTNYLLSSFEERLHTLNLPPEDFEHLKNKNREYIETYIFPSYKELSDLLFSLRTSGSNNNGLCYFPDGKKYYRQMVQRETGSMRTVPELQSLTRTQILEDLSAMQKILSQTPSDAPADSSLVLTDTDPSSILKDLENKLGGDFPAPPDVKTQIKYVQESMQDYLSPAFYMVPAIDDTEKNTIYINQGHLLNDISLYTTLAHEGYPGHLYQTVYYQSKNPDPIRSILGCGGYTEGWATYSEMLSYYYAPIPKDQAALLQRNTSVILGIYALADMGIHYDGWKLIDAAAFFRQYGITDARTIENIYDLIIADPSNYLKYYIGYVEFLELKKEALEKWGDSFTQSRFHKAVLDAGPVPFDILRDYVLN